jgi:hypothetical protein
MHESMHERAPSNPQPSWRAAAHHLIWMRALPSSHPAQTSYNSRLFAVKREGLPHGVFERGPGLLSKKCRPLFKKHEQTNHSASLLFTQSTNGTGHAPLSPGSSSHRPLG